MPFYVHEVFAKVVQEAAQQATGFSTEQLDAVATAVARILEERARGAASGEDGRITGRNRPDSIGG